MSIGTLRETSIFARALRVARAEGLRGILRRLDERREKALRIVFGYLVMASLDDIPAIATPLGDLRVEPITRPDGPAVKDVLPFFTGIFGEETLRARIAAGEVAFVARAGGRAVGTLWAQPSGEVSEFRRRIFTLRPEEFYLRDAFVAEDMRGKNIYPVMRAACYQAMRARGKTRGLSFIRWKNTASIRSARKFGERRAGVIGYVRLFGRRMPFFARWPVTFRL